MKRILAIACLGSSLAVTTAPTLAQDSDRMWRCRNKDGTTEFTNVQGSTSGRDCRLVDQHVTVVPATSPTRARTRSKTPSNYPKETQAKRASAKEKQRQILETELDQERGLLDKSKKALAEQEAVRFGNEKNYARVLARLKPYQDTVEVHQKNVEALERELAVLDK